MTASKHWTTPRQRGINVWVADMALDEASSSALLPTHFDPSYEL